MHINAPCLGLYQPDPLAPSPHEARPLRRQHPSPRGTQHVQGNDRSVIETPFWACWLAFLQMQILLEAQTRNRFEPLFFGCVVTRHTFSPEAYSRTSCWHVACRTGSRLINVWPRQHQLPLFVLLAARGAKRGRKGDAQSERERARFARLRFVLQ